MLELYPYRYDMSTEQLFCAIRRSRALGAVLQLKCADHYI